MTLYEINRNIEDILNRMFEEVDEETGEVNPEIVTELAELNEARDTKIDNIGAYIKNLDAEAKAIKDEMDALTRERKRLTAELLAAMGDHTHACAHTSVGTTYNVTARYSNRKSVDYKAYAADNPGCFDDYTSTKRTFAGVTIS